MSINFSLVVFFVPFVALTAALLALVISIMMHIRVSKIFRNSKASDIEKLMRLHTKTLEDLLAFQAGTTSYMKSLDYRIKEKMKSAPTLRFNPFQGRGVGGNQSFSSVFADEEGNGVVITSMHARERTSVFAKPLKNWRSEYELSKEEKMTINKIKENGAK